MLNSVPNSPSCLACVLSYLQWRPLSQNGQVMMSLWVMEFELRGTCWKSLLKASPWLRKLPACRQHVATTAKCWHILPKCPCRGNTILIPTPFFVSGFADIHQIFLYSTRGTYREFLCKFWYAGYGWGSREILGFWKCQENKVVTRQKIILFAKIGGWEDEKTERMKIFLHTNVA